MDDNRHEMAELWRYAHDPDLLEASVARWAYDRITGLEAALAAVTGWPLRTDPEPAGGAQTCTQAPMPPCYIDADAGECSTERAVVDALMDVGPWDEIDGDGDPGSILADHIRQLPRFIRDECEG